MYLAYYNLQWEYESAKNYGVNVCQFNHTVLWIFWYFFGAWILLWDACPLWPFIQYPNEYLYGQDKQLKLTLSH